MECQELGIYSQAQAVKYLEKIIMRLKLGTEGSLFVLSIKGLIDYKRKYYSY